MITEERLMTLLARANPEPDEGFEVESTAAAYLATLTERSSEVTQLDTRPEKTSSSSRNRWIAVAATVVAIVGAGVVFLTRTSEEAPVATETPVTTLVVPTTQTPTNTDVVPTTTLTAEEIWEQTPVGMSLDGGEARTGEFAVPFRFAALQDGFVSTPNSNRCSVSGFQAPAQRWGIRSITNPGASSAMPFSSLAVTTQLKRLPPR